MSNRNPGLLADPLFVGLTRPPMRFGVTYAALLGNVLVVMEAFVLTKQLLVLTLALPIHAVCVLVCARDARFFDLAILFVRVRLVAWVTTARFFGASSVAPWPVTAGRRRRRRTDTVQVRP